MTRDYKALAASVLAGLAALPFAGLAGAETRIRLDEFAPGGLQMAGFELPRGARVQVEAVGMRVGDSSELAAYAWILDSDTRQPVWVMDRKDASRVPDERWLRRASTTLDLEAGRYELYAFAAPSWRLGNWHFSGFDGLRMLTGQSWDRREREYERTLDRCSVTLTCAELSGSQVREFEPTGEMPGALLQRNRLGDEEFVHTAFRLDKPGDLTLYALVELPEDWDHAADGGWIVNAATRERVWELDYRNTRPAGGDDKNRVFRDAVRFQPGTYELYYGTDDSHSWERFNANPPYDPPNWGITILPGERFERAAFQVVDPPVRKPLVELVRVRDEETRAQAFRLQRDAELLVYALGEYGHGDYADYGWIQKAGSGETVWEMTAHNTYHAGGAEKNRMFDGTVRLPAGEYVANYVTDDSHAYRDWNAGAPYDRDAWGLTLAAGAGMRPQDLELVAESDLARDANVLVRITRVRDGEHLSKRFILDARTRVHVYALGEGAGGSMADYGWIENADTGDSVWEMTWRNTRHAGGADKNRIFDGDILLDAGTYAVHYETDDSHAFGDWNARPPRDPQAWGITVSVARR